jgi:CHAD domain-containing protein
MVFRRALSIRYAACFAPRMARHLKGGKAATRQSRRILRKEISKALRPLCAPDAADADIHAARKRIKIARATLRLLRDSLSKSQYRSENTLLRDAARPLSVARDASVLLQQWDSIVGPNPRADGVCDFRKQLTRERSQAQQLVSGRKGIPRAIRLLHAARSKAGHWSVGRRNWSVLGPGVERCYRQGRDALQLARQRPSDAHFHEWRKQAKYLHHQLQMLRPLAPGPIQSRVKRLHGLSDVLGEDHDLAVLRGKVEAHRDLLDHRQQGTVLAKIQTRRAALQSKALRLGAGLYREPPGRFSARLRRHWVQWRHSLH